MRQPAQRPAAGDRRADRRSCRRSTSADARLIAGCTLTDGVSSSSCAASAERPRREPLAPLGRLPGPAGADPAVRVLPLPGRAHAGLQRRGGHARLVRQGAGRGALPAGASGTPSRSPLLVTLFCLLLGYPLGFLIATTTPVWATLGFIFVLLPLWTSVLVRTYAWMVLLGRNGVINRLLIDAGSSTSRCRCCTTSPAC